MNITETVYNEICQRRIFCSEQLHSLIEASYEEDCAYYEGRLCELDYIIDLLDSLKEKENKSNENLSTSIQ